MLSKEEELRFAAIRGVIETEEEDFPQFLTVETVQWLTEKLKEANDELKRRKLYSPKNQISDRFYPREGGDCW